MNRVRPVNVIVFAVLAVFVTASDAAAARARLATALEGQTDISIR